MLHPVNSIAAAATVWSFAAVEYAKSAGERLRNDEDGQTAAEYTGILVLIAAIFVLIFKLEIDSKIETAISGAIDKILNTGGGDAPKPE